MASKSQQRAWLALYDDPEAYCPTGHQLKHGCSAAVDPGQTRPVRHGGMTGIVADLFGEDRYFADAETFWTAQNAAIADRRAAYLDEGWSDGDRPARRTFPHMGA
jgi:ParB family chromosome partitioning protein